MRATLATCLLLAAMFVVCLRPEPLVAASLELRRAGTAQTEAVLAVGQEVEVALWVDAESRPLSGAAVFLSFDPGVFALAAADRLPGTAGFQPFAPGGFLGSGEVFRNELLPEDDPAAAQAGAQLDYSVVRAWDQGSGTVASVRLRALAPSAGTVLRIDESGARETRVFLPDGSQGPFRFITPLRLTVQGIALGGLPARLVLPRGAEGRASLPLSELVFDPVYPAAQITWSFSPTLSVELQYDAASGRLEVAAREDLSGWDQLVLTATNPDGQWASDTLDVFVGAPPVLTAGAPSLTLVEDTGLDLDLADLVTDPDTPALQLRWSARAASLLAVEIAGPPYVAHLAPQPDWSGAAWVELAVEDELGLADTLRVEVVVEPVNDAPRLLAAPNLRLTSGRQDSSLVVAELAADVEDRMPSLSWRGAEHVRVALRGGRLVVSAEEGWTGVEQVVLQATDSGGLSATAPLTVTVVPSLPPAILDAPARRGMAAGTSFVLALDELVSDPDDADDALSWQVAGQQSLRVQQSSSRAARVEAPATFAGTETLTFTVTDPTGRQASFALLVFAAPAGGAPLLAPLPEVSLPVDGVDASVDLDDYVFDLDGAPDELQYFVSERAEVEVRVDPVSHMLTVRPREAAEPGWLEVEVRVLDPDGHEATGPLRILLTGEARVPAFTLTAPAPVTLSAGGSHRLDLDGLLPGEVDPAQIAWSAEGAGPLAATIDPLTHEAVVTPASGWTGEASLTFVAAPPAGAPQRVVLPVTVLAARPAPALLPLPTLALQAGGMDESLDLDDYVTDAPAELAWEVAGERHVQAVVDAATHRLVVVAKEGWSGQEVLVLTGRDGAQTLLEGVLRIDVVPVAAVLELRPAVAVPVLEGDRQVTLDPAEVLATSADPAGLTWQAEGSDSLALRYDAAAGALVLTAASPWLGSETVTLRARDAEGHEASAQLRVETLPADGSLGEESERFRLAVVPHPLHSAYVDAYVLGDPAAHDLPRLRRREGDWADVPLAALAPGLWHGTLAVALPQTAPVQLVALALTPARTVLRSTYSLEAPAAGRGPLSSPAR
ncbi:MAG: hypothetical protein AB1505_03750 [Candidatus Latescibacterota bacterium]